MATEPGIQGAGWMGVALEVTPGTFVTPSKFVPFLSESMTANQETVWRRPIRGAPEIFGAVPGNTSIAGDIKIEALHDVVPYFLTAARTTKVKSGSAPNFTYVFTPAHFAVVPAGRTMSIMIVKNGEVFVWKGCTVGQQAWTVENGLEVVTFSTMGLSESAETVAVPVWGTSEPFGAGQYTIKIPSGGSAVLDTDSFTFTVNDNGSPAYRLRGDGQRGPTYQVFGERNVTMSMTRDFLTRADFDAYKALTATSISVEAAQSADRSIKLLVPRGIREGVKPSDLSSQGELIMTEGGFNGVYDAVTSKSYEITVKTSEDIV